MSKIITIAILSLLIYVPLLSLMSPDTIIEPTVEIDSISTEPTIVPTTYIEFIADTPEIDELKRYDRNNDGILNDFELKVIETDYHHKRLTKPERDLFISIIGYTPVINPIPIPTAKPIPTQPSQYIPTQSSSIIPSNYYESGQSLTEKQCTNIFQIPNG